MQVSNFILLLTVVTTVTAQPECLDGQLRLPEVATLLEYCHHGEWRWICHDASQWNITRSEATCGQLGYSDQFGQATGGSQTGSRRVVTLSDCNGPGLAECTVTPSDNCNSLVGLTCVTANCAYGETRLVGGSTDREGRVEVCVGGAVSRWRTVCTGSQDLVILARGICLRTGIESLVLEGSTVAVTNSFPPGAFPEYSLECRQSPDGELRCSLVEGCNSFVELEVVCKNYEDLYNECSRNCIMPTLSTNMQVTTELLPTSSKEMYSTPRATTNNNGSSTSLVAVIAVLVVLQVATMIALISTCVVFKRKLKQKVTMATQQADLTYAVVGGTHTEMKIDLNIAANPAYEAIKCDQEDHTYDVVNEGVASRQRRGN